MPYKFETNKTKLPKNKDRRIKITNKVKEEIKMMYAEGVSIRGIARESGVSRRSVQFIIFPERLKRNLEVREERGGWKQYYSTKEHTVSMREHRRYKQKILKIKEELK